MSTYSTELSELTRRLQSREKALQTLQDFAAKGGHHRLSIHVDHPDSAVIDAVADIAQRRLPTDAILKGLIGAAKKDVDSARLDIINLTLADSQAGNAGASS